LEECAEYAGSQGIFLGMENDGGVTPNQTLDIVHGVKSPWFGLNLDLGNFHTDDIYRDVARCAPYAINVHFKKEIQRAGRAAEPADIQRMLGILREANYQGYLALEYEADADPYQVIPGWRKEVAAALAVLG
jgi:sugar phosphate isomerase/epimerase